MNSVPPAPSQMTYSKYPCLSQDSLKFRLWKTTLLIITLHNHPVTTLPRWLDWICAVFYTEFRKSPRFQCSTFPTPVNSDRTALMHTHSTTHTHTRIMKQRKSSRQGRLTQGRDGRLFIHRQGGSRRTNTASNTGKCDSGVWEVKVYKVQHNRHMNCGLWKHFLFYEWVRKTQIRHHVLGVVLNRGETE